MSLDRSLKSGGGLSRHRNVLTRAERIAKLAGKGKFDLEEGNPLGLVKVASRKVSAGGKATKKGPQPAAEAGQEAAGESAPSPGASSSASS